MRASTMWLWDYHQNLKWVVVCGVWYFTVVTCDKSPKSSLRGSLSSAKPLFPAMSCHCLGMLQQKYGLYIVLHEHYKEQVNSGVDGEG